MTDWPRGAFKTKEEILAYGEGKDSFVCYLFHPAFDEDMHIKKSIVTPPWFRRFGNKTPMHDNLGGYFPHLITQMHEQVLAFPNYWDAFAYVLQIKRKE
jgi:hypothetical protein